MRSKKVEIVETSSGKVVRTLGPKDERSAERIERGLSINLDHERFHTRIVDA